MVHRRDTEEAAVGGALAVVGVRRQRAAVHGGAARREEHRAAAGQPEGHGVQREGQPEAAHRGGQTACQATVGGGSSDQETLCFGHSFPPSRLPIGLLFEDPWHRFTPVPCWGSPFPGNPPTPWGGGGGDPKPGVEGSDWNPLQTNNVFVSIFWKRLMNFMGLLNTWRGTLPNAFEKNSKVPPPQGIDSLNHCMAHPWRFFQHGPVFDIW